MAANHPHPYQTRQRAFIPYKRSSNYVIGEMLGEGAFSEVYFSQHPSTKKVCALKRIPLKHLDENFRKLCKNEVSLLNQIKSKNVVQCFESFMDNGVLFVVLEYLDGGDLSYKILEMKEKCMIFCERTIWYIFHQICCGMKDLHERRILHRDLKPANVFINSNGIVKIGDLGLSRLFSKNTQAAVTLIGNEWYRAPERNNGGYHFKSDIWALGCLLYELCTLRTPFNGETENVYALHKKIQLGYIIPFPSDSYSRPLIFFLKSCLSLKAENRPTAEFAHMAARRMYSTFERLYHDFHHPKITPMIQT